MRFSAHIDNKKKDILVLGICPVQGLEHTLTAEKMYSINFTLTKKKVCLSLHYNKAKTYLFVSGRDFTNLKQKDFVIVATSLCLRNISKDWLADNMKKQSLMDMSMILVFIMMLLMLMILLTFTNIWWKKIT